MSKVLEIPFPLASLPWKERVKLSIEKLEDGMEETRRDLLIIGKNINHMTDPSSILLPDILFSSNPRPSAGQDTARGQNSYQAKAGQIFLAERSQNW